MFDFIANPLIWIAIAMVGLVAWWVVMRLLFRAYYRSRLEYYKQIKKEMGGKDEPV